MQLQTAIERVTVFNNSALITRIGKLPKWEMKGESVKVYVEGLPLSFEDSSLRVGFMKQCSWAVRNVQIEIDRGEKEKKEQSQEKLKELKKECEELEVQLSILNVKIEKVQEWMASAMPLNQVDRWYQHQGPKGIEIERKREPELFQVTPWMAFTKVCTDYLEKLHENYEELNWKLYKLIKEIEVTKEQYTIIDKDDTDGVFYKNLIITLGCMDRKEIHPDELTISYIIPGAKWIPVYKLYIEENYKKVKLVMGAQIAQRSGEDWQNIKLEFSSASLERRSQLPELPSKRIGRAQTLKSLSFRKKLPSSPDIYRGFDDWLRKSQKFLVEDTSSYQLLLDQCKNKFRNLNDIPGPSLTELSGVASTLITDDSDKYEEVKLTTPRALKYVRSMSGIMNIPRPGCGVLQSNDLHTINEGMNIPRSVVAPTAPCRIDTAELQKPEALPPMPSAASLAPINFKTAMSDKIDEFTGMDMRELRIEQKAEPKPRLISRRASEPVMKPMELQESIYPEMKLSSPLCMDDTSDILLMSSAMEIKDTARNYMNYELMGVESADRGQLKMVKTINVSKRITVKETNILQVIRKAREAAIIPDFIDKDIPAFQFVFEAKGRASIPQDGHPHTVDIMSDITESKMEYRTIPMTDLQVFRGLAVKNPFDAPLSDGSVQVFVDNAYVLTTKLKGVGTGGKAYFPIGVEPNIKIARNTSFYQEEKGIMGGTSIARHTVDIELRSHMSETISVEVIERVPFPDDNEKDIGIKIVGLKPESEQQEFIDGKRVRGTQKWKIDIEPGGTGTIKLVYDISLPSKMELCDGNRRV
ncbi:MAG TPA: DUF4139 domain-containing protein [Candidatus Eremiobacteraeota bacterium]|nr:DUF4139 domain-containing protein [Candidatus Eremiobacteraeota bacterium]